MDCYEKAKATGEPVFVLRAQDTFAPLLVEVWASMVGVFNANKADQAEKIASNMRTWQKMNGCKVPD